MKAIMKNILFYLGLVYGFYKGYYIAKPGERKKK
tara:strand:- start:400 stop:501 length:102 start_codon:yes stop_codon:yes gene_type:complete